MELPENVTVYCGGNKYKGNLPEKKAALIKEAEQNKGSFDKTIELAKGKNEEKPEKSEEVESSGTSRSRFS